MNEPARVTIGRRREVGWIEELLTAGDDVDQHLLDGATSGRVVTRGGRLIETADQLVDTRGMRAHGHARTLLTPSIVPPSPSLEA